MRTLPFMVNGQKLTKNGDFSHIVRGTKGYLECLFKFEGADWMKYKGIAVFESNDNEYAVPIKNDGTCTVPDEVTDESYFKVKVVGVRKNSKITSTKELIEQE